MSTKSAKWHREASRLEKQRAAIARYWMFVTTSVFDGVHIPIEEIMLADKQLFDINAEILEHMRKM